MDQLPLNCDEQVPNGGTLPGPFVIEGAISQANDHIQAGMRAAAKARRV